MFLYFEAVLFFPFKLEGISPGEEKIKMVPSVIRSLVPRRKHLATNNTHAKIVSLTLRQSGCGRALRHAKSIAVSAYVTIGVVRGVNSLSIRPCPSSSPSPFCEISLELRHQDLGNRARNWFGLTQSP
ncbi:hypothetical protein AVEN_274224-1 [Araneus ventricosus]|uniref:Uncharacterized protein n=1 Tax=Araneus ventricosus TaxID=182803 RepID=A0A4Y2G7D4_ARAVE|nr:hypothetical protein AVEN_274224-1 [Araneus ventricosus]